jgi:hypothetical protein
MTASRGLTMAWQQDWSSMSCSGVGLAACPLLARADPPTGFKFEAGALASHAAASLVLRPITAAFVAHAWAPPGNNGSSSGKCPVGFGAMARDPYTYKVRQIVVLEAIGDKGTICSHQEVQAQYGHCGLLPPGRPTPHHGC